MQGKENYWFPAKRYGWGWGPPRQWQGRVVLCIWLAANSAAALYLLPGRHVATFGALTVALALLLGAICYATGEPPAWRWGR